VGSLECGKKADSVNMAPIYDCYGAIVYSANASNVETTIVNGRIVVRDKELVVADMGRMCSCGWIFGSPIRHWLPLTDTENTEKKGNDCL